MLFIRNDRSRALGPHLLTAGLCYASLGCAQPRVTSGALPVGVTPASAAAAPTVNSNLATEAALTPSHQPQALPDTSGLLKATYNVTVRVDGAGGVLGLYSQVHLQLCSGPISLSVNPSFAAQSTLPLLDIASGVVACGSLGTIDVAKALGLVSQPQSGGPMPLTASGDTLALSHLGSVTFSPVRPIFPAIFSAPASALQSLDVTTALVASNASGSSASGQTQLKMTSFNVPFTPPSLGKSLPKVMDFAVTTSGFANFDRPSGLLFDRMEFRLSLAPFSLLQMVIQSQADVLLGAVSVVPADAVTGLLAEIAPLSSVIPKSGPPKDFIVQNANAFKITVTLDLASQDGLDQALANSSAASDQFTAPP